MILYIEKPKNSTKKLLELINEFSKVAGYKLILNLLHLHKPRSIVGRHGKMNFIHVADFAWAELLVFKEYSGKQSEICQIQNSTYEFKTEIFTF